MSVANEQLFERYLRRELSAADAGALRRLLEEQKVARKQFVDYVNEWSLMADVSTQIVAYWEGESDTDVATRDRAPHGTPSRRPGPAIARAARPWGWWVTGIAAALLIGFGFLLASRWPILDWGPAVTAQSAVASVARLRGEVFAERGGTRVPLAEGRAVYDSDRVVTRGVQAVVWLTYPDATRVELATDTAVRVEGADRRHRRVTLEAGLLNAQVSPLRPGEQFRVSTPHAEMSALGTRFAVEATSAASRVDVEEGRVAVENRASGERIALAAGQYAAIDTRTRTGRHRPAGRGPVVLYTFAEGQGATVRDVSGVGRPLDLKILDRSAAVWLPGGGLQLTQPTLVASHGPARKIDRACRASNEISLEAWIVPAAAWQGSNTTAPGPVRILTVSVDGSRRNFTLGHWGDCYKVRLRTTATDPQGEPALVAQVGTPARLTHVVYTRDAAGTAKIYADGVDVTRGLRIVGRTDFPVGPIPGRFTDWDETFYLGLGDELTRGGTQTWLGTYHLIAVYRRALSAEEVRAQFRAGPRREKDRGTVGL
ncbi:MAG: FecR domain-containing protein [Kiritimatiellae bacterium]|nr:FecR domain-containing protein [Kiritimatiellia bacterium]